MDPRINAEIGNEYILGQLTLSDNISIHHVQLNLQGKFKNNNIGRNWDQKRVIFRLETPDKIPSGCMIWFDGCNNCLVGKNGIIESECSDLTCNTISNKRCIRFNNDISQH